MHSTRKDLPPREEELFSENEKALKNTIKLLEEAAERFNSLEKQAKDVLENEQEARMILTERALLIEYLPEKLRDIIKKMDSEQATKLTQSLQNFATRAREAINSKNIFVLGVLLTNPDHKIGDKNELEKLIDNLKK